MARESFRTIVSLFAISFVIVALAPMYTVALIETEESGPIEIASAPLQLGATFERAQNLTTTLESLVLRSDTKAPEQTIIATARERQALMQELARTNPEAFLSTALSSTKRSRLSATIQQFVETEYTASAELEVKHVDDFENTQNSYFVYTLVHGGQKLDFKQAGGTAPLTSGTLVQVNGYRIGNNIVAYPGTHGLTATAAPAAVAVPSGRQKILVVLLYDKNAPLPPYTQEDMNNIVLNSSIEEFYKDQSYDSVSFAGTTTDWIGLDMDFPHGGFACNLSFVDVSRPEIADYLNANGINPRQYPRTLYMIYDMGGGCSTVGQSTQTWDGRNYKTSLSWSGVPGFALVQPYVGRMNGEIFEEATVPEDSAFARCVAKARANVGATITCSWNGSTIYDSADPLNFAKNFVTSHSYMTEVTAHELGHALGVMHANAWKCFGSSFNTPDCRHEEYGNYSDTMGHGEYGTHFNAYYKDLLGWIPSTAKKVVRADGREKITSLATKNGIKVLEIQNPAFDGSTSANTSVFLELRTPTRFDYQVTSGWTGIHINQAIASKQEFELPYSRLLNAKQATQPEFTSPALQEGGVFNYPSHGIRLGNVNINANTASVNVRFSVPECKTFPLQTKSYGGSAVVPGDSVFITVTIHNMNFPLCGDSKVTFQNSNAADLGWEMTYRYPETPITLAAADTGYMFFHFQVPADASAGDYLLEMRLRDRTYGKTYKYSFPIHVVE